MSTSPTFVRQKDLLAEIWKSKLSYCLVLEPEFTTPDQIVTDLGQVTVPDQTIRLDTHEHMALATGDDIGKGKLGHLEGVVSFDPFILYRSYLTPDGKIAFREVARSHQREGRVTNKLGRMLVTMTESYARRGSWRNYSYVDEMRQEALLNLCQNVLRFNDAKTNNAHAYITRCLQTAFIRELRKQQKQGIIKDEIMMILGENPSYAAYDRHKNS